MLTTCYAEDASHARQPTTRNDFAAPNKAARSLNLARPMTALLRRQAMHVNGATYGLRWMIRDRYDSVGSKRKASESQA